MHEGSIRLHYAKGREGFTREPALRDVGFSLLPNKDDVVGFAAWVVLFEKHVAKFVLLTAPVGTGQIKSVRCIRTRREPTRRVGGERSRWTGPREGLVAPPQNVAVSVQQHVGLERVAPAVVRQPQLGHARGQRRDAGACEFAHQRHQVRFVDGFFHGDFQVRADRDIDGLLVNQGSRVALHGCERDDGEGEQHDHGQSVHRFGRARPLQTPLHVVEQRRATEDDLHDLRPFGSDSTEQERPTDPQRKGSEDADEALEEEVGNNAVAVTVGLQPRVGDRQHTEQEGQPVQPTLWLGDLGCFSHPLFNFKLDEAACATASEQQRQTQRRHGGEHGGPDRKRRVDVEVTGSEFHEANG